MSNGFVVCVLYLFHSASNQLQKVWVYILFFLALIAVQAAFAEGCDHCKSINEFIEMQYEDYRMVLEYIEADRSYIEGKADAYREMTYFLEPFIYRKK